MKEDLLVEFQITLSTADEERCLYPAETPLILTQTLNPEPFPFGVYRVVDGQLFRVSPSPPPVTQHKLNAK